MTVGGRSHDPGGEVRELRAALEAREAEYRALIDTTWDGVFVADPAGRYLEVNERACAMLGFSRAEILAMTVGELIAPGEHERVAPALARLARDGHSVGEWLLRRKQGPPIPVEVTARMLPDGRLQGFVRDVSERRRVEAERQAEAERLRQILEGLPVMAGLVDLEGRLVEVNQAPLALVGLRREEVLGKPLLETPLWPIGPEDRERLRAMYERAVRGEATAAEIFGPHYGGRYFQTTVAPVRDASGAVTRLVGATQEITRYIEAEQRAAASERRLREILDALPVIVAVFSPDGRFQEVNRMPLAITGVRREQLIGRPLWETPIFSGDSGMLEEFRTRLARVAAGQSVQFDLTFPGGLLAGRSFLATQVPFREGDGGTSVVHCMVEITDRKRAEEWVAASERRLRELLDALPISVSVLTPDGRFEDTNRLPLATAGLALEDVVGKPVWETPFWAGDDSMKALYQEQLAAAAAGETIRHDLDLPPGPAPLAGRSFLSTLTPLRHPDGTVSVIHSMMDVTERKRAEQNVAASERRMRELLDGLPVFVTLYSPEGRVVEVNRAPLAAVGASREQVIGELLWKTPLWSGGPAEQVAFRERLARVAAGETVQQELTFPRGRFGGRTFLYTMAPLRGADGAVTVVHSLVDITERKRAEETATESREQLRALAARLQEIREEERRALARELHDRVGQVLTSLKLEVGRLDRRLAPETRASTAEVLREIEGLLDEAMQTTRRLSSDLRPSMLDDLGLAAALEWQAAEFARRTGIRCEIELPREETPLDPDRATAVFRIFQEALTNVARHAAARRVRAALRIDERDVVLEIRDDGRGITPEETRRPGALGLLGMRERAHALGGEVTFSGRPGQGTTVLVRIPRGTG